MEKYLVIAFLLSLSGIFSGLTLSLMSLSKTDLARKAEIGDKKAKRILSIRKNGNLLLCTLIIGNVGVNTILSIYLGSITNGVIAAIIATGLIVIFGEILPQAAFSRFAFKTGYFFAPFVKGLIYLLYPVGFPLAWFLNKILGEEVPTVYEKKELEKLIEFQKTHPSAPIDADEARIITGALNFSDKKAKDVMTPENVVFCLEANQTLNQETLDLIKQKAFSRVPVYEKEKDNIIGLLYVKDLIGIDYQKNFKIKDFVRRQVLYIQEDELLDEVMNKFIKTHIHLGIVVNEFGNFEGVISLEDILEEIIKEEIVDEYDKIADLRKEARERSKSIREKLKRISFHKS